MKSDTLFVCISSAAILFHAFVTKLLLLLRLPDGWNLPNKESGAQAAPWHHSCSPWAVNLSVSTARMARMATTTTTTMNA